MKAFLTLVGRLTMGNYIELKGDGLNINHNSRMSVKGRMQVNKINIILHHEMCLFDCVMSACLQCIPHEKLSKPIILGYILGFNQYNYFLKGFFFSFLPMA